MLKVVDSVMNVDDAVMTVRNVVFPTIAVMNVAIVTVRPAIFLQTLTKIILVGKIARGWYPRFHHITPVRQQEAIRSIRKPRGTQKILLNTLRMSRRTLYTRLALE